MKKLKIVAGMVMTLLVVTACDPLGSKTQASQASTGNVNWFAQGEAVARMANNTPGIDTSLFGAEATDASSWCDALMFATQPAGFAGTQIISQLHAAMKSEIAARPTDANGQTLVTVPLVEQEFAAGCKTEYPGQSAPSVPINTWAPAPNQPTAPSPVNTSPALLLTCQLEYNVPANHPVGSNGIKNQSGWITPGYAGETDWTGGFTASPPAGWQPGVHIVSTQVYPWNTPQPAAGYSVTITLTNAAGSTVYTTSKTVRVTSSEMEAYNPIAGDGVLARDVPIGSNAAGADKCSAVVN
jgi:hypothetical protein